MILGTLAGLGASFLWALAPLIAQRPARSLGAFEFTRIQLVSSFTVLVVLVSSTVGWSSASARHASSYAVGSVVGVILANLAMVACLRRGGAQRMEALFAMNAPIAAGLSYLLLGEGLSAHQVLGIAIGAAGVLLAVLFGRSPPASGANSNAGAPSSLVAIAAFGLAAAACNAIGLIALRPVLVSGTEPLVVTALRTGIAALIVTVVALWPARAFQPPEERTLALTFATIAPGIMGYVAAVCLQLYALKTFGAGTAALLGSASPVMILPMIWTIRRERPAMLSWVGAMLVVAGAALAVGV